jgi:hypothetical protein
LATLLRLYRYHGTKLLGVSQVILGAVAANAGHMFSARTLQMLLMASGVLTSLRGYQNTRNAQ